MAEDVVSEDLDADDIAVAAPPEAWLNIYSPTPPDDWLGRVKAGAPERLKPASLSQNAKR